MTRWEYNTVVFETAGWFSAGKLNGAAFQAKLDELGAAGWELVSVFDTNRHEGSTMQVIAVFKRSRG
jgi:hypothetical protein